MINRILKTDLGERGLTYIINKQTCGWYQNKFIYMNQTFKLKTMVIWEQLFRQHRTKTYLKVKSICHSYHSKTSAQKAIQERKYLKQSCMRILRDPNISPEPGNSKSRPILSLYGKQLIHTVVYFRLIVSTRGNPGLLCDKLAHFPGSISWK